MCKGCVVERGMDDTRNVNGTRIEKGKGVCGVVWCGVFQNELIDEKVRKS